MVSCISVWLEDLYWQRKLGCYPCIQDSRLCHQPTWYPLCHNYTPRSLPTPELQPKHSPQICKGCGTLSCPLSRFSCFHPGLLLESNAAPLIGWHICPVRLRFYQIRDHCQTLSTLFTDSLPNYRTAERSRPYLPKLSKVERRCS